MKFLVKFSRHTYTKILTAHSTQLYNQEYWGTLQKEMLVEHILFQMRVRVSRVLRVVYISAFLEKILLKVIDYYACTVALCVS